jgi:ATP/maltotriose-dependent transcriptional regulator MalT
LGVALLYRDAAADRQRGLELTVHTHDTLTEGATYLVAVTELVVGREEARRGESDSAIPVMQKAADDLLQARRLGFSVWGTGVLVETLLDRGADGDAAEAEAAIARLAALPADGSVIREVWLLRVRALLARAQGDESAYRDYRDRYRGMAKSLGFEGHIACAEAMP